MNSAKLLALHGNVGMPGDWSQVTKLRSDYQWDCLCLWEFLREDPSLSLTGVARLVAEKIKAENYDLVMGYSLGGRILLHALQQLGASTQKALLVSSNLVIREEDVEARLQWDQEWAKKIRTKDWSQFLEEWNSMPLFQSDQSRSFPEELSQFREEIAIAFENWSFAHHDFDSYSLMQLKHPISLVTGELDSKCHQNNLYWSQYIEKGRHVTFPSAAHRLILNQPEQLVNLIDQILDF